MNQKLHYFGRREILHRHKVAFLCSRTCPADVILKSYDWAIAERAKGTCVISGFHSQIEKDVLGYLLKGTQPIILALARGFKQRWESDIKTELDREWLLIVTPFEQHVKRITRKTAEVRNRLMLDMADEIRVAYTRQGGQLVGLLQQYPISQS
ncbi:MAG: DNA-binding protein [bacterium]|nr:DNA-binding protein [bacterium]